MGACLGKLSGSGGGVDADALSLAGRPASSSNFGLEASSSGVVGGGGSSSSSSSSSSSAAAAAAASLSLSPPRPAPAPERLRASYYGLGPDGAVDDAGGTRRQRLRRGVVRFNGDARAGLAYLAKHGLLRLPLDPAQVAAFLHGELDGGASGGAGSAGAGVDGGLAGEALSRHRVGEVLGSLGRDEEARRFHAALLAAYCARFDFAGLALVPALRAFLGEFRLPGEAQVIDRLMSAFAAAYARDNIGSSGGGAGVGAGAAQPAAGVASASSSASASAPPPPLSADAAYVLSFAAVMLNTVRERGSERAGRDRAIDL